MSYDAKSIDTLWDWWILNHSVVTNVAWNNVHAKEAPKVTDLLLQHLRGWDVLKLRALFPPHIVQVVLKISLLPKSQADSLIWAQEKCGIFKVKSVYRFI